MRLVKLDHSTIAPPFPSAIKCSEPYLTRPCQASRQTLAGRHASKLQSAPNAAQTQKARLLRDVAGWLAGSRMPPDQPKHCRMPRTGWVGFQNAPPWHQLSVAGVQCVSLADCIPEHAGELAEARSPSHPPLGAWPLSC